MEGQVLIAEDDANDAYFIQRAFQRCGFTRTPHICGDGQEIIDYLEGQGDYMDRGRFPAPVILITDLKMPRVSGFELLQWLHDHRERMVIPTVVMTSSKDPSDVKRAYCLGANAYICKPTSLINLEETLRAFVQFWNRCETSLSKGLPTCGQLEERQWSGVISEP